MAGFFNSFGLIGYLDRGYIICAGAFFALSDVEVNLLAFIQSGIPAHLDFRMVDEQIIAAVIRGNKAKSLDCIEPFYCTCTHSTTPGLFTDQQTIVSQHLFMGSKLLRDERIYSMTAHYTLTPDICANKYKINNKGLFWPNNPLFPRSHSLPLYLILQAI